MKNGLLRAEMGGKFSMGGAGCLQVLQCCAAA